MTPTEIVKEWVKRFNAGDAKALAALYHVDAVNHQVTQDPIKGRENIFKMFETEFAQANMVCIIDTIHQSGNVGILEWHDPLGLLGCGFFTTEEGLITFQRGYWDKLSFLRMHNLPIE